MKDRIIDSLQSNTRDILLSIINDNKIDYSNMAEDAVWVVGSAMNHYSGEEMQHYLDQNIVEEAVDTPEFIYSMSDYMGSECISLLGEIVYHIGLETLTRVEVNFQTTWLLIDGDWKLKQLITTMKYLDVSSTNKYVDSRIDPRVLLRVLPVGMAGCMLDEALTISVLNGHLLELLGYESITEFRHFAGSSIRGTVYPEDIPNFENYVHQVVNDEESDGVNVRLRKKDFTYTPVQIYGTLAEGKWLVFVCFDHSEHQSEVEDIKHENEKLGELHDKYRVIVDNVASGFYRYALYNPVHIEYVNDSFCNMMGYSRYDIHERMNSVYTEMVVPEDRHLVAESMEHLMEYPHTEQLVYSVNRKDGSVVRVLDIMRSVRHDDGKMWGYSVVTNLDELPNVAYEGDGGVINSVKLPRTENGHTVEIHTFGYFEVILDGKPIAFRSAKARELLALLVDRKGNYITRDSIISMLWENESINPTTLTRCRKTFKYLVDELKEYGIEDIVETENGMRRLVASKVKCDLLDYINGVPDSDHVFNGVYLTEYSWSEITLMSLISLEEKRRKA